MAGGPIVRHLILAGLLLSTSTGGVFLGYHLRGPSPELVDALKTHGMKLDAFGQRLERLERRQRFELMALAARPRCEPESGAKPTRSRFARLPAC